MVVATLEEDGGARPGERVAPQAGSRQYSTHWWRLCLDLKMMDTRGLEKG